MEILWKYLRPQRKLLLISLFLAGIAQLLNLLDPIIFGKIVDKYAANPKNMTEKELVKSVVYWLSIAVGIAVLAKLFKSLQEYLTRKAVAHFGMSIFNDGLKQTLRLSFQEFEENRSGTTLSILQKVKTDTERFVNSFINILFSSLVGIGFLLWYSINKNWMLIPVLSLAYWYLARLPVCFPEKLRAYSGA